MGGAASIPDAPEAVLFYQGGQQGLPQHFLGGFGAHSAEGHQSAGISRPALRKILLLLLVNALPLPTLREHEGKFGLLYIVQPAQCCQIRKGEPLMRNLEPFDWWFTGLRREQSPTRAGLLGEPDIASLKAFGEYRRATFTKNLAARAKATASNTRGNRRMYGPANLVDGQEDTVWATDDGVNTPQVTFDLAHRATFSVIRIREAIQFGQRIDAVAVDRWD